MREVTLEITKNIAVSKDVYLMRLEGDLTEIKNSGEFIEIKIPNYYLRRPISVHRYSDNYVEILYKVLGHGTKDMTSYTVGLKLDVLVGLGNGFDLALSKKPLLIAGGIGIAPMFELAHKFNQLGIKPTILFGAAKEEDLVLVDELKELGNVVLCTDNGSVGYHGNPVSYLKNNEVEFDYYYACGPEIMLKFLKEYSTKGCLSLEARMGCGFGACMGCSIETTSGPKRVCKEGPVFDACEVIF
jgi:dihydroorotate dehydrogenase electron transfer subunit